MHALPAHEAALPHRSRLTDRLPSPAVVLAALGATGFWIVIGAWLGLCLLVFLFSPRDVQGRKRATGCIFGLIVFFGAFLLAFAAWAADHVF